MHYMYGLRLKSRLSWKAATQETAQRELQEIV